ncbi:patatin-like phospholipase family protein [Agarivorans sp. TSD2052]|uniref:patatin-like phospholipase family protein n=1 Tax=Agarivorans sp. TSD2052 TaxID=2937286 RepID=UPI00200D19C4|nr:patatin-like phospholipase family protein [Agarivorans sp. TSD2052]UPW19243.1 patatin-like phospholipase family protein [Agarivorans sp. TSD2052]
MTKQTFSVYIFNALRKLVMFIIVLVLVACSGHSARHASQHSELMSPLATSGIRYWDGESKEITGHDLASEYQQIISSRQSRKRGLPDDVYHLALSGGGINGAFSAGVLNAWTVNGNRPEFDLVTGVSTGAIVSIFAYLGSDYDQTLKNYYTNTSMSSLFELNSVLSMLGGKPALNTKGFEEKVRSYVNTETVAKLANERSKGRLLIIGTTNLDNEKMSMWDIGKIAQVGTQQSVEMIQNIIIASSSVPGAFPAQTIIVDDGKQRYEELHVDGGVSRQVFLAPQWAYHSPYLAGLPQHVYVIRNGVLKPNYQIIENSLTEIGLRSISTMIRNQGIGDVEHIYHFSQRHKMSFHLAYIDNDFPLISEEAFTKEYMTSLYYYGYQNMLAKQLWETVPPSLQLAH